MQVTDQPRMYARTRTDRTARTQSRGLSAQSVLYVIGFVRLCGLHEGPPSWVY